MNAKRIVIENFGKKGYWKQRLAMQLSYQCRSLKEAWSIVNDLLYTVEKEMKMINLDWIGLISESMAQHPETVCTIGD